MKVNRFRKKPVVIEAAWFEHPDDGSAIAEWCGGSNEDSPDAVMITTMEGAMRADVGDWIIRGVQGEFYPCKSDIFEATYEPAVHPGTPEGPPESAPHPVNPGNTYHYYLVGTCYYRVQHADTLVEFWTGDEWRASLLEGRQDLLDDALGAGSTVREVLDQSEVPGQ